MLLRNEGRLWQKRIPKIAGQMGIVGRLIVEVEQNAENKIIPWTQSEEKVPVIGEQDRIIETTLEDANRIETKHRWYKMYIISLQSHYSLSTEANLF